MTDMILPVQKGPPPRPPTPDPVPPEQKGGGEKRKQYDLHRYPLNYLMFPDTGADVDSFEVKAENQKWLLHRRSVSEV